MPTTPNPLSLQGNAPAEAALAAHRFAVLTEALGRTSAHTGQNALKELARAMGEILSARRAHISRFCPESPGQMRFMALWYGATLNFEGVFPLRGSASEQTLLNGEQHYWEDLAVRFPHNAELYDEWCVCSYLGAPLIDSQGKIIGVISVMFGPGEIDRVLATTVFRLFATRAAGELDRMQVEERRGNLERALSAAVRGTASVVGEAFFSALVLELARALGARAVYLTRLHPVDSDLIVRLAGVLDGRPLPSETVELPVTSPTRDTLAAGYLHVADSLRERYPDHPLLESMQVDSFIGVALRSARGETIGALTLLGLDPVQDTELARSMLLVFSARAAAEIQRVESDAAVARIDAQLRHTQKLEALGTLAGGVAHDFNNILAGILGNTQLAQLAVEGRPAAVRHHLDLVVQSCGRARDLIGRILAFSRNHEQPLQPCALRPLVEEALQLLKPGLPHNITLRTVLPPAEIHILADPGQIHQILLNLGTNAVHALSPQGGTLEVSVADIPADDAWRSCHVQIKPEHTVRISVRDDGPGIPPELHERIFEPFFTTKPPGQGSGLGLAGVHGMIRAHAGAIVLDSVKGKGTTFHLCFERCEAPRIAPDRFIATDVPVRTGRNLLFVDDEPMITEVASIGLKELGWNVRTFNDARSALAEFQKAPSSFDALVTDLSMPGMNGAALAKELLALRSDLPVVIITGYMRGREVEEARLAGVTVFLSKPFELHALDKLLRPARAVHSA